MTGVKKVFGVLLALSIIVVNVGFTNNVQAASMLAYDIGHEETYDFTCTGDSYTALMDINGHMIISADRKTIDIYYDIRTSNTNSFVCLIKAYSNNSLMSQRPFENQQYFVPSYGGWDVNNDFTYKPSGHFSYTYSEPVEKIKLGYSMWLKPASDMSSILICNEWYEEIIVN